MGMTQKASSIHYNGSMQHPRGPKKKPGTKMVSQHCNICFSIVCGDRRDNNQHLSSQKYRDAELTLAPVKHISSFMARCDGDRESDEIVASEGLFAAHHTVCHGQDFL